MPSNVVLFIGADASGDLDLWETDGTAAVTHELTGIAGAGTGFWLLSTTFVDTNFAPFNGEVWFGGYDTSGQDGLWETDGTVAGTHELKGIAGASGPDSTGVMDVNSDPTAYNGKLLFFRPIGVGTSWSLWETDGTADGTREVIELPNTVPYSSPDGLTVLNGKALFRAVDTSDHYGLWVTDGTAIGTHELTGIVGADPGGLAPSGLTVYNGKVLFAGLDASHDYGLWVTDGTATGTHELIPIVGAASTGVITTGPFTPYKGVALFSGTNATGQHDLWETDGTAAGTHEVTGAGMADSAAPFGFGPSDLTVFNGEVLFSCEDTSGASGLWVTDGTAAGTHELTGITGASDIGINPDFLTVYNGEVLFDGYDASGNRGLWETDGTATGTHELTPIVGANVHGVSPSYLTAFTPPPAAPATSDILWQNTVTGQASIWDMSGSSLVGGGTVSPNPGPSWRAVGTGDFNKDGHSDILWQNASSGQASIWEMSGNTLLGGGAVSPNPGPDWKAIGTGDFTGDGFADDILWQNTSTGQASIWEMDGESLIGGGPVSPNPGLAWKAIGTGDFNKDGDSDILWQNKTTGQVSIWEMDGNSLIGGGALTTNPGPSWQAIGTGDFTGDGFADDILFQNKSTGQVSVWEMDGTSLIGGGKVSATPGTNWHAIGTGASGSDILLQNTNGQASIWDMHGNTIIGGGPVSPNPGSSWRAVGLT